MNPAVSQHISPDEALMMAQMCAGSEASGIHLTQYILTIGFLAAVNFFTSCHYHYQVYWVVWVALGWGIGLLFHGLRTFDKIPFLNGEWERRQVEKQLGRKLWMAPPTAKFHALRID